MGKIKGPPPPGYIAFVNETINTTLGIKESLSSIRMWAKYGPSAKPFLDREYKKIVALAITATRGGG